MKRVEFTDVEATALAKREAEREEIDEARREATANAVRVASHRARQRVDNTPAELAGRLRGAIPLPPPDVIHLRAEYHRLAAEHIPLEAKRNELARAVNDKEERDGKRPSLRALEAATAAVEEIEEKRRDVKADRDRAVKRFENEVLVPYLTAARRQVREALLPTLSALKPVIADIAISGDQEAGAVAESFRRVVEDLAPGGLTQGYAPSDLDTALGHACVLKDAWQDMVLLGRACGESAYSGKPATMAAARALAEQIDRVKRRAG